MFAGIRELVAGLREAVAELEPGCWSGADAAQLVEVFAEGEKVCAAGKALAARRVEDSNYWRRDGYRSAAQWVAKKTGTSPGHFRLSTPLQNDSNVTFGLR